MKTIEIVGENYSGSYTRTRVACRGIVLQDGKMLLSYENATDTWMIPGGGREADEDNASCCRREVAEETGCVLRLTPCVLEIDEYYENARYVSFYYFGSVTGQCERKLTDAETANGMIPRWIPVKKAEKIFARHADFAAADEMKRGLYLREYTALQNLIPLIGQIVSFEKILLRRSGMRGSDETELLRKDGMIEISEYGIRYSDGEERRVLLRRAECEEDRVLRLLNDCQMLAWDGFVGKHPFGVTDGIMFTLEATVNDGKTIYAHGSQNFPKHYHDFTDGLYELLKNGEIEE